MSVAGHGERLPPDELRKLFLFEKLDDEQLDWLSEHGWVVELPGGATVFEQGEPAEVLVVLLGGVISMSGRVGRDDVETVRTGQVGVYAGAMRSYVGGEGPQVYTASVRVVDDARFFVLRSEDFAALMRTWFPMAVHLLDGLFLGMRNTQRIVGQRQQLLALGALSAGLTHELNNPAAAALRATSALRTQIAAMRSALGMLAGGEIDARILEHLVGFQNQMIEGVASAPRLTALEESQREDEIGDWLDERDIPGGWDLAPVFVGAGVSVGLLDGLADATPPELLGAAIRWLACTLETELLLGEITDSITRISSLVGAARQYSHLDRVPHERVDVHTGLDSTLIMLSGKLSGVEVVTDYDRSLPPIPVYAAELNQVWTNLIDNAVQAMEGAGRLTVGTRREGDCLRVEIRDTGPGVPAELTRRVFEPFFTTKPIGQGTGLGLDISYRIVVGRHGGDLYVESEPGDTRFIVRLPLNGRPES
ncbi:ATP-binding protein [Rhizohabitans arisaemae]|uniref:ATP-binding protein n=1 Tax=Rhizohabitans arisaemae TaxID=2720610 RepID=UPI0024B25B66|nr:ATP-binding protein [Rhizohabitans arisaemae]